MVYVSVREETKTRLCLLREPTLLSRAVFVAFFVGILGIFLFGSESFFFKVLIGVGATSLSFLIVDNYEICEFDKTTGEVRLTRMHWCQFWLGELKLLAPQPYVTARLADIKDVRVEEQGVNSGGKAYQVILSLDAGIQLGVTEVFTTEDISEHEKSAKLIKSFLSDLPPPPSATEKIDDMLSSNGPNADDVCDEDGENSSLDEDFEQITSAELENLEKEMEEDEGEKAEEEKKEDKDQCENDENAPSCPPTSS